MLSQVTTFISGTKNEFKNVTYLGKKDLIRLTALVISGSLLVGFLVGGIDLILSKGLAFLISVL